MVIAAGWPVDDADAEMFALRFYDEMLDGACFIDAVGAARKMVYADAADGRRGNTWGAYQCSGDPHYRLTDRARATAGQPDFDDAAAWARSRGAVVRALDDLVDRMGRSKVADDPGFAGQIAAIGTAMRKRGWQTDADLAAKEAAALVGLDRMDEAIDALDRVCGGAEVDAPVRAFELLHDLRAERAFRQARRGALPYPEARALVERATKDLTTLIRLVGANSRRRRLLAGCHARAAVLAQVPDAKDHLDRMVQVHAEATGYRTSGAPLSGTGAPSIEPDHLVDWLIGELILFYWFSQRRPTGFVELVGKASNLAMLNQQDEPSLAHAILEARAELLRAMADEDAWHGAALKQRFLTVYDRYLPQGARAAFRPVIRHLDFVATVLDPELATAKAPPLRQDRRSLLAAMAEDVGKIREDLRERVGTN